METRVQDKWWKALCGAGLLTFFALSFFCDPHSEPDDDWTYSYLIAGRMGPLGTNHYMNPALVGVLKAISRVLPWINVYEVFRVTLVMAAFAALCLCLFRILQPPCAFAMSALLVFVYWKDTMLTYNFTFTAGLCAAAGALLLCCYATEKMHAAAGVCGALLWLVGFAWRWETAILLLPYACLLMAAHWMQHRRSAALTAGKRFWKRLLACAAAVTVCMAAAAAYGEWFWTQPGWNEYLRFDDARSAAVDFTLAPWEEAKKELEPLGVTKNDYWCAQNWIIADTEAFDLQTMEAIGEQKVTVDRAEGFGGQTLQYILRSPLKIRACAAFVLAALLVAFTGGLWQWLTILCAAGGSYAISLYFLWQGRLIDRVEAVIWLGAICVAATQIRPLRRRGKRVAAAACGAGGALLLAVTGWRMLPLTAPNGLLLAEYEPSDPAALATMEDDSYYLWDVLAGGTAWKNAYGNVHLPAKEFLEHNGWLGGWTEGSPALAQLRKKLGMENPMRALAEKENVYMVNDRCPDKVLLFIQEHYEPQAALSVGRQLGENVWALKFTSPLKAQEVMPVEWELGGLTAAEDALAPNWYTLAGSAEGLEQAQAIWLRVQSPGGGSRCYRLAEQGGGKFLAGMYFDWTNPEEDFQYTLMWQKDGRIYESADKK